MRSHSINARIMYGSTEQPKTTAASLPSSRDAAAKVLYRSGSGMLSDQPFASAYSPRITNARSRNDYREAARLETEQRELRKLAEELKLDDRQTLKIGNALRDTDRAPLTRRQLTERDSDNLRQKFGEQAEDAVQTGLTHAYGLLKDKPVLDSAIRRGGTWAHEDVIHTAAEAAIALGLVKHNETKQS